MTDATRVMYLEVSDDVRRWMDQHTKNAVYIFEGNSNEELYAWQQYKDHWKQENSGFLITVGTLLGRPICISVGAFTLYGQQVFKYEATSMLVDHEMIDEWLNHHFPKLMPAEGYQHRIGGSNFHIIAHAASAASKEAAKTT